MADPFHRLAIYLNNNDLFFRYDVWPEWAQERILLPHKDDKIRFQLLLFFLCNGLDPDMAIRFTMAVDYVGGHLIPGIYTAKQIEKMERICKRFEEGHLPPEGMRIWDCILGYPITRNG